MSSFLLAKKYTYFQIELIIALIIINYKNNKRAFVKKLKFSWLLIFLFFSVLPTHAFAGHLFTQASANTPIALTSGTGLQIDQLTYEGGSNDGRVLIYFDGSAGVDQAATDALNWSAGDALKVTIGSWVQTFNFDTLATDFAGSYQSAYSLSATDPTLVAANITPGGIASTFTVVATAGAFTFTGYRITVVGDKYNGTGAGPINQSQVVQASQLGSGGFEPAATSLQKGLGTHLDAINGTVSGPLATVITVMDAMTDESKALAMKLISPEQSRVLGQSTINVASTGFDTVQVRLDSVRVGGANFGRSHAETGMSSGDDVLSSLEKNIWMKALGGTADRDAKGGFAGSDSDFHGIMAGIDFTTDDDLTVGAAFSYAKTNVKMSGYRNGDGADIDTYQLTTYFSRTLEKFYVEGMFTYADQDFKTTRNTHLTGVASGSFGGNMFAARLVAGLPLSLKNNIVVTPFLGVEAYHLKQKSYSEKDAGALSLDVESNDSDRLRSLVGARLATAIELADGSVLSPSIKLNWKHEFKNDGVDTTSSFLGGGGSFQSIGQNVERDMYALSGRINWQKTDQLAFGVEIGAETASGYSSYNGNIYGRLSF